MSSPRVSVVVPVRDRRALLRNCLAALAAQTFTDAEVIVVDDGSTDGSAEEARAVAVAGQPVRLLHGSGDGAVAARTLGVAAARGEILAFTDSDCVPDPGWLAAGVGAIDEGADVVQGRTQPVRPAGLHERTVWVTFDDGLYATCNVLYRRPAFEQAGGFDRTAGDRLGFRPGPVLRGLGFGEDTLLGWRVRRRGRSAFVEAALVRHEVLRYEPREAVRRSWHAVGFPALVREVPELRRTLLRHRVVLGTAARLPLYGLLVAAPARRHRVLVLLLSGWWLVTVGVRVARHERRWGRRAKLAPVVALGDVVTAVALVAGSARARAIVL
ncbi:hypothetical protein BH24ACT3_BH24ACT3_05710 [soil metagenome]